jgi:hypothetical protein
VAAHLDDLALRDDSDHVRLLDRAQPVSDHNNSPVLADL